MAQEFQKVVEHVFSNWTALKLAVEHSMGGPDSRAVALQCLDYMVNYCLNESDGDVSNIQEALEDILDEEFETICEDGSTREVAEILSRFVQLISMNNMQQFQEQFLQLPPIQDWLIRTVPPPVLIRTIPTPVNTSIQVEPEICPDSSNNPVLMDADMEWTVVTSRKKR